MREDLKRYKEKRDFKQTTEPEGEFEEEQSDLRFVVQHHIASSDHYDFRLEWEGVLLSWAVPKGPSFNPKDKRLAVKVEDHPLAYRNFEGTIPKDQYGGGTVMIWDEGTWIATTDFKEGLEQGQLKFRLYGERLKGDWTLVKWKARSTEKQENWLLIKEKDENAKEMAGISDFNTSVRTGRTMSEIEEEED